MIHLVVDADDVELREDGDYDVTLYTEDVFDEIDDFDLEQEYDRRDLGDANADDDDDEDWDDYTRDDLLREVQSMNADEFRRLLCDMTGKMYCVSSDELLDAIKERL